MREVLYPVIMQGFTVEQNVVTCWGNPTTSNYVLISKVKYTPSQFVMLNVNKVYGLIHYFEEIFPTTCAHCSVVSIKKTILDTDHIIQSVSMTMPLLKNVREYNRLSPCHL